MTTSQAAESFFLFFLSIVAYSLRNFLGTKESEALSQPAEESSSSPARRNDRFYLERAHQLRRSLDKPKQSQFRVVALLLLKDGSQIFGTNDEPSPSISSAICAERAAFLSYRTQQATSRVDSVFIVTDADRPVPPGCLCREYMYGHDATTPKTRIVMQSKDPDSEPWILFLKDLLPFPSIYTGMTAEEQVAFGTKHEEEVELELEHVKVPGLFFDQVCRLLEAAHQACLMDDDPYNLHPMRYGAAVAIQDANTSIEILTCTQLKAVEYGSTLDALTPLISQVVARRKHQLMFSTTASSCSASITAVRVLAFVQVDQFGIPHAPFASARSLLVEHGLGDSPIILTTTRTRDNDDDDDASELEVCTVTAQELAPFLPEFR